MARQQSTSLESFLLNVIAPDEIRRAAYQFGFVKRRRKVKPVAFIVLVVLTVCGRGGQCLAELRRALEEKAGVLVARSSFWNRFNPALERVIGWMLGRLQGRAEANPPQYTGLLKGFKDVVAADATVIQVPKALEWLWSGTGTKAAIKVHTRVRALTGELLGHQITAETRHESKVFGVGWWARGVLFLLDRGYACASLWWRIARVGGFFLVPLKKSFTARIVQVNTGHRGSHTRALGRSVWELARGRGRKGRTIDVQCAFRVDVRGYGDSPGRHLTVEYRVVGRWNRKEKRYHLYVTNIPVESLDPEECSELYRLRWEVETFYKTAKGGLGLHEITSSKPHIVRIMVGAALIRACITMQARLEAMKTLPPGRWINPGAWVKTWRRYLERVLETIATGRRVRKRISWDRLAKLAMDPNRARMPLRYWCLFDVEENSSIT